MSIRPYRSQDAAGVARLSAAGLRAEADFVLNPLWSSEEELEAEFARRGIEAETHLLVAEGGPGEILGLSGFLRGPEEELAGMVCPIVDRGERGKGIGGELLRAALELGSRLGVKLATAGIGTRNRAGYALLTAHGFRPVRQHFLMRCSQAGDARLTTEVDFELAAAGDLDAILEIYTECDFEPRSEARMQRVFGDGLHLHAVARQQGRVVGFVEIETHWPQRVWVAFVGVRAEQRDRGVGAGLVSFGVARCFEKSAQEALLLLSPANRTAMRAYEKVGFRRHRLVDVLQRSL